MFKYLYNLEFKTLSIIFHQNYFDVSLMFCEFLIYILFFSSSIFLYIKFFNDCISKPDWKNSINIFYKVLDKI